MDFKETAFDYLSCDAHATFYTSEAKWMRKIKKLQAEHPDEVQIVNETESDMLIHIPKTWMRISPPKKMNLTDEQRAAAAQRLAKHRAQKGQDKNGEV